MTKPREKSRDELLSGAGGNTATKTEQAEQLIGNPDGSYAKMFEAQAQYYR